MLLQAGLNLPFVTVALIQVFKVADWLNPVAEGILDYWLLGAFQVVIGFVVFKGLYRVWGYTVEASPYTFFRRMRAQVDEKAQGRPTGPAGSLALQRLELLDGGDWRRGGRCRWLAAASSASAACSSEAMVAWSRSSTSQARSASTVTLAASTSAKPPLTKMRARARVGQRELDHAGPQRRDHRRMAGQHREPSLHAGHDDPRSVLRHQHALGRNELELEGVSHPRGSSSHCCGAG